MNTAIPIRRPDFTEGFENLPKHFAKDGDIVMSHIIAMLSAVFPEGEDFFVRSVRNYRGEINPELKNDVKGFIGQEAVHGRSHREFNEKLQELGYPTHIVDSIASSFLKFREKVLPDRYNLALTAALEHYTATLAEELLGNPEAAELLGDSAVKDLFMWHALEESEHKAVAFDVLADVDGNENLRIWTMRATTVLFLSSMTLFTIGSILMDNDARGNPKKVLKSFGKLRENPWLSKKVRRVIGSYSKIGFHPWNDASGLKIIDEWRGKLFGNDSTDSLVAV